MLDYDYDMLRQTIGIYMTSHRFMLVLLLNASHDVSVRRHGRQCELFLLLNWVLYCSSRFGQVVHSRCRSRVFAVKLLLISIFRLFLYHSECVHLWIYVIWTIDLTLKKCYFSSSPWISPTWCFQMRQRGRNSLLTSLRTASSIVCLFRHPLRQR